LIIRRLHLVGFGKFTDREIELEEGLNVFYGPNESGKTTIQSFLKGMLYGFKRPDVRRRLWTPELERYMPWSGKPYIGVLEFMTSEGRTYCVERTFAKDQDSVRILDAITGRDMSSLFELDERRERLFAEKFTGMNELVFCSTVCMGAVPDAGSEKGRQELAARLANLQESADEATSVRRAVAGLERARRSLVYRQNRLQERAEQAEQAMEKILVHRAELRQLELRMQDLEAREKQMAEARREARTALLAYDISGLQHRLSAVRDMQEQIKTLEENLELLSPYARVPIESRDELHRLQTRIEEAEENLETLDAAVDRLEGELANTEQQLQALPGASGLVSALASEDGYAERARAINLRLTEAVQLLEEAEQARDTADEECQQASRALLPFLSMAELPEQTLDVVVELDASVKQAAALQERLQAQARRRRILAEHLHGYEDRTRTTMRRLVDLEIMDALPDDAARRMEGLDAEIQAVTRAMEETQAAYGELAQRLAQIDEGLASYEGLDKLPEGIEAHLHELELRMRSGEQRLVAVRALVEQLETTAKRQDERRELLRQLDEDLERTQHVAHLSLNEVHAAEAWLERWQTAEKELTEAIGAVNAASAAAAKNKADLAGLEAVTVAGIESLTRAETLVKQEDEQRKRAQQAAIAAEGVELPPVKQMQFALALLVPGLAGVVLGLFAFGSWPVAGFGLALVLSGTPLLAKWLLERSRAIRERDHHYRQKSEATVAAEKTSAELRSLLGQVRQPSVVAWRESWKRIEGLHRQQMRIENQLALATQRRNTAGELINRARQALVDLPLPVTDAKDRVKLSETVRDLGKAVVDRQELERATNAVKKDIADEHIRLSTLYDDTVEAIRLLLPKAEPPGEPDIAWARRTLAAASDLIEEAGRELSDLLSVARVKTPAELLDRWKKYQALLLRKESLMNQLQEHERRFDHLLSRRRAHEDQVLRWLEIAGICPRTDKTEQPLPALPWKQDDVEQFMERHRQYRELRNALEAMPQEIPKLLRDVRQLLDEVHSSRQATQQLRERLQMAVEVLPSLGGSIREAAVALEKITSMAQQAEGTGLPEVLWPAELDSLLADLPTAGLIDRWARETAVARQQASSLLAAIMDQAGSDDVEAFRLRWQERQHLRQQLAEKQHVRGMRQEAYDRQLARTLSLLAAEVEPILKAADLSLLEDETRAADIAVWQESFAHALERLDEVEEIHGYREEQVTELQARREELLKGQQTLTELIKRRDRLLGEAGADSISAFETLCEGYLQWRQTETDLTGKNEQLEAFLGETTPGEIEAELQARREEWMDLTGLSHEQVTLSERGRAFWEDELDRAENELAGVRERRAEMLGDMKSRANACEDEERIAAEWDRIRREQEQLQEAMQAVMLAAQELDSAAEEVHRQFAPMLNEKASEILKVLTRGRYERLAVSETLDIVLQEPDYAKTVALDDVSQGTGDQVYLAFRLAAAEVICGDQWAPPLIMDDAFAHYDDYRVQDALRTLFEMSKRVQVLFFTCRQRELEMLPRLSKETGIGWRTIELEHST
jgi:DNA repair exonuclease SbcCD ATPase subunit